MAKPNLEELATKLANIEEEHLLHQITPTVLDAFFKYSKKEDEKGNVTYKTKFSDEEKEKIADAIFDALSYHVHVRWSKDITPEQWKEMSKYENRLGERHTDNLVALYLGIDREGLKRTLKGMDEIRIEHIQDLARKAVENHANYIQPRILKDLEEEHLPYLKDWLKEKIKKYEIKTIKPEEIDKKRNLNELLPIYSEIASRHYKK